MALDLGQEFADMTKNRLKLLLLTLNTLTCSNYVSQFLVIYNNPDLSIKLLDSLLTTL